MTSSAFEQAALHACKVAAWVLASSAIPALLALYSGNVYWMGLAPFINGLAAGLKKWSGIQAAAAAKAPVTTQQ
ncbi:MAG TPA: hypothetical protein VGL53_21580 [Bryobacteraceae bacterium]|jgi:hypothetical protein